MALSEQFTKGVGDLMSIPKLDPPVNKTMSNAQAYASSADELGKLGTELSKAHGEVGKAVEAYNKLVAQMEKLEDAVDKHGAGLDKALKVYLKQGRNYPQKAYETGCDNIEAGMKEVDKAVLAMKNKYPEIKLK